MRRTRILLAVAATAATAFAPISPMSAPTFELATDDDPATEQPVVLLLGADADVQAAYDAQPVADRYAFAAADLGCGDLGGPADRAALTALAAELARADGTGALGVRGAGIAALQALSTAASPEGRDAFTAIVADDPITDPHDLLFSEGGVARQDGLAGDAPSLGCEHDGATDGTRDEYWADRDVVERLDDATAALFLRRDDEAAVRQLLPALPSLDEGRGDLLHAGTSSDPEAIVTSFLDRELAGLGVPPQMRYLAPSSTYSLDCVLGQVCTGLMSSSSAQSHFPPSRGVSLFINRTFEQDLDCTPACVPGPGTGEIGTLEDVNRFTPPHAPVFTWVDAGANSEHVTAHDPLNEGAGLGGNEALPGGHGYHSLAFHTPVLDRSLRLLGRPRVEGWFNTGSAGGTITPILVAVGPTGTEPVMSSTTVVARGALDLDLAGDRASRAHVAGWKAGTVVFDAVDVTIPEGWRLMLVLQSSNVDAFEPGEPQGLVNVATGPVDGVTTTGSVLHLPISGGAPSFSTE